MSARLVVEDTGFGVRGALVQDGRLVELIDADADGEWVTDGLFLARVTAVDHHLNAAYLDCGLGASGFLAAKDARHAAGSEERRPIGRLVREGQRLIVQGLREGGDGKGPRFTTELRLFGFYLILRPHGRGVEASARLRGRAREELLARGQGLFGERGLTLRRLALGASDALLAAEAARLEERWRGLRHAAEKSGRPGRLAAGEHPLERLLRTVADAGLAAVEVADPALFARARASLGDWLPEGKVELVRLEAGRGAFEQTGVAAEIGRALGVEVPLERGGRLLIQPTAACTAIDVDGEGRAALELDLEAAAEVGRQARLRNLGGTLIVDFVDLPTRPQRQRLEEALRKAFHGDPAPVQIYPMSPLGIVQIGRARRGRSLAELMGRACPACAGTGRVPSLRARAEGLMAELRALPAPAVRVRAAPDLAGWL
ncbi:MAG TPA: ribonuclease E/G, partial [Geminicoccaceae bacterium]|nr:ribonuclease E/G [Geminicoccaceae bacterium]